MGRVHMQVRLGVGCESIFICIGGTGWNRGSIDMACTLGSAPPQMNSTGALTVRVRVHALDRRPLVRRRRRTRGGGGGRAPTRAACAAAVGRRCCQHQEGRGRWVPSEESVAVGPHTAGSAAAAPAVLQEGCRGGCSGGGPVVVAAWRMKGGPAEGGCMC